MSHPYIKDRGVALYGGYALVFAGLFCLRDAYERRGAHRPWWAIFIPGG